MAIVAIYESYAAGDKRMEGGASWEDVMKLARLMMMWERGLALCKGV